MRKIPLHKFLFSDYHLSAVQLWKGIRTAFIPSRLSCSTKAAHCGIETRPQTHGQPLLASRQLCRGWRSISVQLKGVLMPNELKPALLRELKNRYGSLRKLEGTQSLYEIGEKAARVYIRYSKLHTRNQAFYGLRKEDLQQLEGHASVVCFLWDGQSEPLFVPFA